ncbi:MAG: gliding motility-associated C-terminal domain-containing protein [Bacteroidales bacterium]|nr:gliding motility-associated C-terminal domain-containing protein [Bacteroidales bacterium]
MFRKITLFYFSLLTAVTGIAQIYSPDPHFSDTVNYFPGKDSVFVFNQPNYGDRISITLASVSPDSANDWAFAWYKYDTVLLDYTMVFAHSGMKSEIDTITTYNGYRLIRSKGAYRDTAMVWVLFHDYNVKITTKDSAGNIPVLNTTCSSTTIRAATPEKRYRYHIPGVDSVVTEITEYDMAWEKDIEEGGLPTKSFTNAVVLNLPYENTMYTMTVTSRKFKLERKDSVNYIAVKSKADIGVDHILLSDLNYYPEHYGKNYGEKYDPLDGKSAPTKFKFYNKESKNAASYKLKFGDYNNADTVFYNIEDTIIYEYLYPGKFTATLYTYAPKPRECEDSSILEITISNPVIGEKDSLKLPDVFTPNGDGYNDVFRTYDVSVYNCTIIIFNRYGQKVHEFSGNIRDWTGWDGKIKNSNREASEGIYYYVIDQILAFEYSEKDKRVQYKEYDDKQKTGYVYLFRNKK